MKKYEHGGNVFGMDIKLDFSVNTNPLGLSENIKNAVKKIADSFGLYPDGECRALRCAIAASEGVPAENVVCSNGASEMIFAVVRAVMPERAMLTAPSFSEYERSLLSVGCDIEYYDTHETDNFTIGSDIINRLDGIDMMFICNPNNPTGTICNREIFQAAAKNTLCVVDESFMDLAGGYTMKGVLPVIKAFTKTYAMAGLRLGYLIADGELCEKVASKLPAWNVSLPAQAAGLAALEDSEYLEKSISLIKREREYLLSELNKLGFTVFNSAANFLLIKGREGIGAKLLKRGILIRECENFRGLDGRFYRVAVKKHEENIMLIKELGDICG